MKRGDTADRIHLWYLQGGPNYSDDEGEAAGVIQLTDKEKELKKRWQSIFALLLNYHSQEQAVAVHMEQFGVTRATAYRDVRQALALFGDIKESDKKAYAHILVEYQMKILQLSLKKGDLATARAVVMDMAKIKGVDRDDPEGLDPSKLEAHEYIYLLPEALRKYMADQIKGGTVNLNDMKAEDVEFEDVSDGEASEED